MAIRVSNLVDRVQELLEDFEGVSWTPSEILASIEEAARELAHHPYAWILTEELELAGGARQRVPDTRASVEDLGAAYEADGTPTGTPTVFELTTMARFRPSWVRDAPGPTRQWAKDLRDPRAFWVYPPAEAGQKVDVVVRALPPGEITMETELPLDSSWAPAFIDYALARAFGKDAEHAGLLDQAAAHMQKAMSLIQGGAGGGDS